MTKRYKLIIEYNGSLFNGWQKQGASLNSVQSQIEEAVFSFCQQRVEIYGGGRTDAGVHALAQVAHLDLVLNLPESKIRNGINYYLKGKGVVIVEVSQVPQDFHARLWAKERYYTYLIYNRPAAIVLGQNRGWHVPYNLDCDAMQQEADCLIGTHDFTSFRSRDCQSKRVVKSINAIKIEKSESLEGGSLITIVVSAQSFLYNQVRIIVGTLIEIGRGRGVKIKEVLQAKDRRAAGPTAPPYGLYLTKINY